tara:strand:- start:2508 stop:2765 length:258 start_codon:yes stop_codon:yes gene_type:complete
MPKSASKRIHKRPLSLFIIAGFDKCIHQCEQDHTINIAVLQPNSYRYLQQIDDKVALLQIQENSYLIYCLEMKSFKFKAKKSLFF